jgi:hypothetical protein
MQSTEVYREGKSKGANTIPRLQVLDSGRQLASTQNCRGTVHQTGLQARQLVDPVS